MWKTHIGSNSWNKKPNKLILADNMIYFAIGSGRVSSYGEVIKMDIDGNQIWSVDYSIEGKEIKKVSDMQLMENGNLQILAQISGESSNDLYLLEYNANGELQYKTFIMKASSLEEEHKFIGEDTIIHVYNNKYQIIQTDGSILKEQGYTNTVKNVISIENNKWLVVGDKNSEPYIANFQYGITESNSGYYINPDWLSAEGIEGDISSTFNAATTLTDGSVVAVGKKQLLDISEDGSECIGKDIADGIIARYDANGKLLWSTVVNNGTADSFNDVQPLPNGGYVIVGRHSSDAFNDMGGYPAFSSVIMEYNSNNEVISNTKLDVGDVFDKVKVLAQGDYIIGAEMTVDNGASMRGIKRVTNGVVQWNNTLGWSNYNPSGKTVKIIVNENDVYVASMRDGMTYVYIAKFDLIGNKIWELESSTGELAEIYDMKLEENGNVEAIIRERDHNQENDYGIHLVKLNANGQVQADTLIRTEFKSTEDKGLYIGQDKLLIVSDKQEILNRDGTVIEQKAMAETVKDVLQISENEWFVVGNKNNEPYITKYSLQKSQVTVPQTQEVTFNDAKKSYNITTAVEGTGGTILGQGQAPYETVLYKGTSTKDIIATPTAGYGVSGVTVNGQEISFTREADGSVILDKFVNMAENKHVVVKFTANPAEVIVHHYKDGTTQKLAPDETIYGETGKTYTTSAKQDITKYTVVTEKLPANGSGTMQEAKTEVIYYYQLKDTQVVVHHYKDGTTETLVPDEIIAGKVDTPYETNYKTDITDYEVVMEKLPTNSAGTMTEQTIEIIYYYKAIEKSTVTTHHYIEYTEEKVAEDEITTGKVGTNYTTAPKVDLEKYEVVTEKLPENATGVITQDPIEVTYYYRLKDTNILVHHYKDGTTEKLVPDETITGKIDDNYETSAKDNISNYEVVIEKLPANASGTMTKDVIEIIYYYQLKKSNVIVHHYLEGTAYSLAPDEETTDVVGTTYTSQSKKIEGYELVTSKLPTNATGVLVEDKTIEVIYYYAQKEVKVTTAVDGIGGTISGQNENPYESVIYGEDSIKEIIITPDKNYRVKSITVNGEAISFVENIDKTVYLGQFMQMKEDKHVVASFEKMQAGEVTVKYLEYGTDAELAPTESITGECGDPYVTQRKDITNYEPQGSDPINATGNLTEEPQEVIYYYVKITGTVTVKYVDIGTNEEIASQEILGGYSGESYDTTSLIKDIENYELVQEVVENQTGTFRKGDITVVYRYQKLPAKVIVQYLEKGTNAELATQEELNGNSGDNYDVTDQEKYIKGYHRTQDVPSNIAGIMTPQDITVIYYYERDVAQVDSTVTKTGTDKITDKEQVVDYTVNYHTVVDSYLGDAVVTITDTLPYAINLNKSDIKSGTYDETSKTITWVENINDIDTYANGPKTIDISKNISVVYKGIDPTTRNMTNTVKGKIELPTTGGSDEKETTKDTAIEIKGNVIVHHYIKDTTTKLSADVNVTDLVGNSYTSSVATDIPANYQVVVRPVQETVTITEGTTELIYYYEMKDSSITDSTVIKTGTDKITDKEQAVNYTVNYHTVVDSYLGDAVVTITDTLPYAINLNKSDIKGGTYDESSKTITWTETISNIDTFANGAKVIDITKNISVVYKGIDPTTRNMTNTVKGKIELPTTGGSDEKETTKDTAIEIKGNVIVHHYIKDTTTKISEDVTVTDLVGNTVIATPADDIPANYQVVVRPVQETVTITEGTTELIYYYEMKESSITDSTVTKTGTDKITDKVQPVSYTVSYHAVVNEYIGDAVVTITDTLPYAIDEANSSLSGGIYDESARTITWTETVSNIDTFANGSKAIDITKNISVVYKGIDPTTRNMTNTVKGKIELPTTGGSDEKETTKDTQIEIKGNVIVHHYIKDTTTKLSEDVTVTDLVGNTVIATPADDIPANYQVVVRPVQETVTITEGITELIYYYDLKEAHITDSELTKIGTDKITDKNAELSYTVQYKAAVDTYIGNASVTIVDSLPYAIDLSKSDIAGGIYNEANRTITWVENIKNIDTFVNGATAINVSKTIKVVYVGIEPTTRNMTNTVNGKIELETTGTTDEKENTKDTAIEIKGNVIVHHYIKDTTTKLSADVNVTDLVGNSYTSSAATDIPANYQVVVKPAQETVTITEGTTELIYYYEMKESSITDSTITKTGTDKITDKEQAVNYTVSYHAVVNEYIGDAVVTITDTLPYAIDEANSSLSGGIYDESARTITWTETVSNIDTFTNGAKTIDIAKNISVVYKGIDPTTRNMTNTVKGKIELPTTGGSDEKETTKDTAIEIKGNVIVHHYIKDTTTKLSEDVTANQLVGTEYTSSVATDIPANYQVCQRPTNETVTVTEGTTIMVYYYEMKESSITEGEITKNGTDKITNKAQPVDYTVSYHTVVDSYIGDAIVTIVDKLPYAIDTAKSDIAGGTYDESTKTITWTETINGIDTFTNGAKTIDITKDILVVYKGIDPTTRSMKNKVSGMVELPTTGGTDTKEDEKITGIEIKGNVIVHHYIKDTTTKLSEDVAITDLVGNSYTSSVATDIPANYQVVVRPVQETVTITEETTELIYYYEMKESSITDSTVTKTGTDKITDKEQTVDYTVSYHTVVNEYIGDAVVTITDTLPYAIDTAKSDIAGGTYDETSKTITWTETISNIDTFANGTKAIDITKNISVVYKGIDPTTRNMTNTVNGKIELPTTGGSDEKETTKDTEIEVKGTVVVHHYILDTHTKLSADVTVTDLVGNTVIATPASDIPANYKLVSRPTEEMVTIVEGTTELIYYYQMKDSNIPESEITKDGTSKITNKEEAVNYEISYHAVVDSYIGDAIVTITDTLPYAIYTANSDLQGGIYDEATKTITWIETINGIDTFKNGLKTIDITKNISVVYKGIAPTTRSMTNTVNGKIELPTTGGSDEKETNKNTVIEIKGNVIVHHYIQGTTDKISEDVIVNDLVGRNYTSSVATDIPANYQVVEKPAQETVTITEGTTELTYYYEMKESSITDSTVTKTGTDKITDKEQSVDYTVSYHAMVDSYIGDAIVTITDTLPYAIDTAKSDIAGGTYDETSKTITWTENISNIDTFTNGSKAIDITKNISVVYKGIDPTTRNMTNTVKGKIELPTTGGSDEKETTKDTQIEVKGNVIVHHYIKNTTDKLSADVNITDLVGNSYTASVATDIPANYQVVEKPAQETVTITEGTIELIYYYELKQAQIENPSIAKTGTDRITSLEQKVSYTISYKATVNEYMGTAIVTIKDELPYPIDEEASNLNGGIYDETTQTVTWTETIENINTFENGKQDIEVTKQLNVVFKGMPATIRTIENKATGKIELPVTKDENTQETKKDTLVEIPGKIIIHHYAEGTTTPVAPGSEINGLVGENYETSPAKYPNLQEGYELAKTPENAKGTLPNGEEEVIYEYRLKTYYITTKVEGEGGNITGEGQNPYEEVTYGEDSKKPITITPEEGYEVEKITVNGNEITVTKNPDGTVDLEQFKEVKENKEVIVTFAKKKYNITTKVEGEGGNITGENQAPYEVVIHGENNQKEITATPKENYQVEKITINGQEIPIVDKATDPDKLVAVRNEDGSVTLTTITNITEDKEIVVVFGKIPATVIVKYVDTQGKELKPSETINGYAGEAYETKRANIENYRAYGQDPINKNGNFTVETIEVIYVYEKIPAGVTVKYVDTEGNELLPSETKDGYVGENYTTERKEIPNYRPYGEDPANKNGTYTEKGIEVVYVYEKIPAKVIVKYLEKDTGKELLPSTEENTYFGEEYTTSRPEIENYRKAEPEPNNASGTVKVETIEVIYYYEKIPSAGLIVKYLEKGTNKPLLPEESKTGYKGDTYTTQRKEIQYYRAADPEPENKQGVLKEEVTIVTYYYEKIPAGGITVKYLEKGTNKSLAEQEEIEGYLGEAYETTRKEIQYYKPAEPEPENSQGVFTQERIEIIYYYEKIPSGGVIIKYVDKHTGEELAPQNSITGYVGDDYTTERIIIENYRPAEPEPVNKEGKLEKDQIEVIYYYERIPSGTITVKYVDKKTGEEIATQEHLNGYIGDDYQTESKEVPYYNLIEEPKDKNGTYTAENKTITYYYEKQEFDFSVEKEVVDIYVSGNHRNIRNGKLAKFEILKSQIDKLDIRFTYKITIKNEGEIKGSAILADQIPEGLYFVESDNANYWKESNGGILTHIEDLEVGEQRELTLVLRWKNSSQNFGDRINIARIVNSENEPNYPDETPENDISTAEVVISIITGEDIAIKIAKYAAITISLGIGTAVIIKKKKILVQKI